MSDKYPQITRFISDSVWLIQPEVYSTIQEIVSLRRDGEKFSTEEIQMRLGGKPPTKQVPVQAQGVAVIPVQGVIAPKMDLMSQVSGGTSLDQFTQSLKAAVNDPAVTQIMLDIDSPGGSSAMMPEAAAAIRAAREIKPVVAFVNFKALSGGYYLASQASEIVSTPSGMVGSIGAFGAHKDISEKERKEGVKTTLISAGKHKVEGNEFEPLSAEARAHAQERVNATYDEFLENVALGRGTTAEKVHNHYGEGRVLKAKEGLAAGMIDRIDTFENVLGGMLGMEPAIAASVYNDALEISMECADMEHSDPGTGSPPTPRDDEPEKDKAIKGGWRTDTPEDFKTQNSNQTKEGSIVNREQLIALCEKAKIEILEGDTDEALVAKLSDALDGIEPESVTAVQELTPSPEEAKLLERISELEAKDRVNAAEKFSTSYMKVGQRGFSALVCGKVNEAHLAVTSGAFTETQLKELLDLAVEGVVDYSEKGSSLVEDDKDLMEYVLEIQKANPEMSYPDAVNKAQVDHPEAAAKWRAVKPA